MNPLEQIQERDRRDYGGTLVEQQLLLNDRHWLLEYVEELEGALSKAAHDQCGCLGGTISQYDNTPIDVGFQGPFFEIVRSGEQPEEDNPAEFEVVRFVDYVEEDEGT